MMAKQTRQAICTLDGSKALQLFFVVSWLFWSGETWDNHQVVENSIFICICKYIPMFVAIKHQPGCQPSISEWLKHAQSPFAYIDVHATVHVGSCGYLSEDQTSKETTISAPCHLEMRHEPRCFCHPVDSSQAVSNYIYSVSPHSPSNIKIL